MASDATITLTLAGDSITLSLLTNALRGLDQLAEAVTKQIAEDSVTWIVEELNTGSAIATMRGVSSDPDAPPRAAAEIIRTADLVVRGMGGLVSKDAAGGAKRLTSVVNGVVPFLTLQSGDEVVFVETGPNRQARAQRGVASIGSLTGIVQTLSLARGPLFRIVEETYDHPINGKFADDIREDLRSVWGRRATVEGIITRDEQSGLPLAIADVRKVMLAPEAEEGAFQRARGMFPFDPEGEDSATTIRRLRDAS